jgi:transcriptional regulator with XRE-family HTH domain
MGNTMKDRIDRVIEIRKELKLTQTEFAKRLGIRQTALSMIELRHNDLTTQNVKLICLSFNVNEKWLRTGEGEMFKASPYEAEFFEIYKGLTEDIQHALLGFARELLEIQQKTDTKTEKTG